MSREAHVRVCEGLGVKVPRATRLSSFENDIKSKYLIIISRCI